MFKGIPFPFSAFYNLISTKILEKFYQEVADELLAINNICGWLLDVATGPAKLLAKLSSGGAKFEKIIGLDISKGMISCARKNLRKLDNGKINLICCDAHSLCFLNNSIDFVICTSALHDMRSSAQVFKELFRVIKPSGKLWIYDVCVDNINRKSMEATYGKHWYNWLLKLIISRHGFMRHQYLMELKCELASVGFLIDYIGERGVYMKLGLSKPS